MHDLQKRTRQYTLRFVRLYQALPSKGEVPVIGHQLLRAGTSVGAQVAEAGRAKSRADFVSKIEGAAQELEEAQYWRELLIDAEVISALQLAWLTAESTEWMAILVSMSVRSRNG